MWSALVGSRRSRLLLVVAAGAALAALLLAPLPPGSTERAQAAARTTTKRCADLVVLGARASGQTLTSTNHRLGAEVFAMSVDAARRLDRGTSVRLAGVPYPAVPTSRGTEAYLASVRKGATMMRARLVRLLRACPRTRVALAGFSQGAHVVHRTLARSDLSRRQGRRVAAVALIADPTYDRRTTNRFQVRYGSTARRHHGLVGPGPRLPGLLARRTIDFCNPADLVCSYPGSDGKISMAPQAGDAHREFYETPETVARNGAWLARVMRRHGVG